MKKSGVDGTTKKCKHCQTEIDAKAKICPNCRKKQGKPKWLIALIFIVVIMIIVSATGGNKENAKEGNVSNEDNKPTEKFTYEVTKQYVDKYGISYYIEGSVKNNRDKDYSWVSIEFVCYDAKGNNLGTASDTTTSLLGNETWKFKAIALFSDVENIDHCDYHEITSW